MDSDRNVVTLCKRSISIRFLPPIEYNFFTVKVKINDLSPITHTSHNTTSVGVNFFGRSTVKTFS